MHHGFEMANAVSSVSLTKGFPIETMRSMAEVVRLATEDDMSARARLVEMCFSANKSTISALARPLRKTWFVAATGSSDRTRAWLLPKQANIIVTTVS